MCRKNTAELSVRQVEPLGCPGFCWHCQLLLNLGVTACCCLGLREAGDHAPTLPKALLWGLFFFLFIFLKPLCEVPGNLQT